MNYDTYRKFYTRDWINEKDGSLLIPTSLKSDPPRLRGGPSVEISGFFAILGHILREDEPKIHYQAAYPDFILKLMDFTPTIDNPTATLPYTITFKVIKKTPATIRGNSPHGSRAEPKPMIREQNAYEDSDYVYSTYGHRFDYTVQFDCWAPTRFETEILCEYFENFMVQYTPLLMSLGVQLIRFERRMEDDYIRRFRIPGLSLQYFVRVEKIYYQDIKRIEEIRAKFGINS